jgi:hypothetical protein
VKCISICIKQNESLTNVGHSSGNREELTCDGSVYTGTFDGFIPHGPNGVLTNPDGSRYVGSFKNGIFDKGVLTRPNGDSYEGQFAANDHGMGVAQGKGTYRWQNGASYVGDFKLGIMDGDGTLTRNDFVFEGEFKDGMVNGLGRLIWPDETIEEGNFRTITNGEIVNLDMPLLEPITYNDAGVHALKRYKVERAIAERHGAKQSNK